MAMTFATNINPDGNLTRTLGTSNIRWKVNGYVAELIPIMISETPNTSVTVQNESITADHTVINQHWIHTSDISYTTSAGSITVTCADGLPNMTLYLGVQD